MVLTRLSMHKYQVMLLQHWLFSARLLGDTAKAERVARVIGRMERRR